jgi:peptide/nickel transport system permease protein
MVFVLLRIAPGDPLQRYLSPKLSPALYEKVKENFGLNKSIYEQYFIFVGNLAHGDFGFSYNYREQVRLVIMRVFPFTLLFSLISFSVQIFISLGLIIFISKRRGSIVDKILTRVTLALYSIPTFVIGLGLIYLFSLKLDLLPSSDFLSINFQQLSFSEKIIDFFSHLTLPLVTLSLPGIIIFYKYLRDNIESTYQKNFVKFLVANGYDEKIIFRKHVLPNSSRPLISILGVELGILLGGALITESLFGLPGMGRLTVEAILNRDYPLVIGCVGISGVAVLFANYLSDLVRIKIDKRLSTFG